MESANLAKMTFKMAKDNRSSDNEKTQDSSNKSSANLKSKNHSIMLLDNMSEYFNLDSKAYRKTNMYESAKKIFLILIKLSLFHGEISSLNYFNFFSIFQMIFNPI